MSAHEAEMSRNWIGPALATVAVAMAALAGRPAPAAAQEVIEPAAAEAEPVIERTRFYRTAGTVVESQVRVVEVELEAPILVSRDERIAAPWIADPERLPVIGRFAHAVDPGAADRRIGAGAMRYEEVYFAYAGDYRPEIGDRLLLADVGRRVSAYGRIVEPRAVATVVSLTGQTMRVRLTDQFGPVLESVVALPIGQDETIRGYGDSLLGGPVAQVIAFAEASSLYGPAARAFVNLGTDDGVQVGDEFTAFLPPQRGEQGRVESEAVATLRVIRADPRVSTVRVVSLAHPILDVGMPVVLTRKAPQTVEP
ncbi:MAG TPA: hypothetical protein VNZ57_02210 [Longimicrobiales bacterium]|nr:hypothetical protein [Longimicrobiales bacterium]